MDKQARGLLLADQEEAQRNISRLKKQLSDMGTIWEALGSAIISNPESVNFSDAPQGLGDIPINYLRGPSFPWSQIPQKEVVARLIQDLRKEISRLEDIQQRLRYSS